MTEPTKKYDVFLSHSSADKAAVEALAVRLRDAGLKVFLDKWSLVPGKPWLEGLEKALSESCTCVVVFGPGGPGPWHQEELGVALDRRARGEMSAVVAVLLSGGKKPAEELLRGFLGRLTWVELPDIAASDEAFQLLLLGITGAEVAPGAKAEVPAPCVAKTVGALDEKIRGLEALRQVLGNAITDEKKAGLTAEREKFLEGARVRLRGAAIGMAPWETGEHAEALAAYFRSLAVECSRLPLAVIDARFVGSAGDEPVGLERVYVALDVMVSGRRVSIVEALATKNSRFAVLLGDAGSGKTTFAHYLTILLARGGETLPEAFRGLAPIRLVLREVARAYMQAGGEGTADVLWDALAADCRRRLGKMGAEAIAGALRDWVLREGGLFILDGLDEVPEAQERRELLLASVCQLAACLGPRSRVLVTARPYAFATRVWRLPGFAVFDLAPFDRRQIESFLSRWHEALAPSFNWADATAAGRGRKLMATIQDRAYLTRLAERPLLLTLMATLHSSWGRLPEDRADLYKEIVHLLLGRWQRARMVTGVDNEEVPEPGITEILEVGEGKILQRLEDLAFHSHRAERKDGVQPDKAADISEGEVLLAFKPLLGVLDPGVLLGYLRHRAGLLVERRPGFFAFQHRSFQEYLAASYLAERPDADLELRKCVLEDPAWWREVFLLAVGKARQGGLSRAVSAVRAILAPSPSGQDSDLSHRLSILAGEALVELRLEERAGEDLAVYQDLIVNEVRRRLVDIIEGNQLPARERLGAGLALGRIGDPRPGLGTGRQGDQEIPEIEWCEIPAIPLEVVADNCDNTISHSDGSACELPLPSFFLSRYPVTNAQFRPFIDSGGYNREALWSAEGWAWRQGAELELTALGKEEGDLFRANLDRRPIEQRSRPVWWDDNSNSAPTCPVVGVTWFEAQAYCNWLDDILRTLPWWRHREERLTAYGVRLPLEVEWERAARCGHDGCWPWGDSDFDREKGNTAEANLGRTSPVGMFPSGRSALGLYDLVGNVLEWTSSHYSRSRRAYPVAREDLHPLGLRVVRGGAWLFLSGVAGPSARLWSAPSSCGAEVGFRCGVFPLLSLDWRR